MHYAVPRILYAAGVLEQLYSDLVAVKGWPAWVGRVAAKAHRGGAVARMLARVPDGIPPSKITHWPWFGLEYHWRQRKARSPGELTATYLWAGREFCRRIIRHGLGGATGVYTFNSAGLELLEHARERGLLRVVEQTIAPAEVENQLLAEEHSAFPGWEQPPGADPHRREFAARERAEWESADLILCGSEFVRQGIAECGGPVERCAVVPYGFDAPWQTPPSRSRDGSRLRVLTAGGVGLRKGAPYVLEAARALRGLAEFRWCGEVQLLPEVARRLGESVDLRGPVPRPQMAEHYAWADVFLLPSICEGSATVCYEALAAGLPVITTPNAGSVVRDGLEGFIVPIRDADAIAERLESLARDRELLQEKSRWAAERAKEFTVERYGERLIAALGAAWQRPGGPCSDR
jgi:glycosyltransferase involved in cell wall biosynthesis